MQGQVFEIRVSEVTLVDESHETFQEAMNPVRNSILNGILLQPMCCCSMIISPLGHYRKQMNPISLGVTFINMLLVLSE